MWMIMNLSGPAWGLVKHLLIIAVVDCTLLLAGELQALMMAAVLPENPHGWSQWRIFTSLGILFQN